MNVTVWLVMLMAPLAASANEVERLAALEAKVLELATRVEALEAENQRLTEARAASVAEELAPGPVKAGGRIPVADRIRWSGDFRYRYEEIHRQGTDEQQRSRIRARAGFATDVDENVEIGFGLSTGGDAPASSTQTIGDGGSKKDIALDLAYADWTPYENLHVIAGKFRNPLFQVPSQTLLWDDEWRPEGLAVRYESDRMFASFLGTWLESDSLAGAREWAVGAHAGIYRSIGPAHLTAGAGYFDIGTAGKGSLYGSDTAFAGNSFDCADPLDLSSCAYLLDYREVEVFALLDIERNGFAGGFYGHYLRNLDADRFDTSWTIGTRLEIERQEHPLQFDYFYRSVGADAVYGQLTDSDFGGGGSDAEGHYFKAGWSVSSAWQLSVTWFDNRTGADSGSARDYDRLQLNADFQY